MPNFTHCTFADTVYGFADIVYGFADIVYGFADTVHGFANFQIRQYRSKETGLMRLYTCFFTEL